MLRCAGLPGAVSEGKGLQQMGFPWGCCSAASLPGLVGSRCLAWTVLGSEQSPDSLNSAVRGRNAKKNLVMAC